MVMMQAPAQGVAAIDLDELNRHESQGCHQQDNTDPTQVCNPKERLLNATPGFDAAEAYTQQQRRNDETSYSKNACNRMPGVMSDIKDGSHGFAQAGNHQKP